MKTQSPYKTEIDQRAVRIDLSGVGTAVLEVPRAHVSDLGIHGDIEDERIYAEIADRIVASLPKVGYAVSVIVPLFNEEDVLPDLVAQLIEKFSHFPFKTEFLLCENGSQDQTRTIAERLAREHVDVRLVCINEPSYGGALRMGIQEASADLAVIFNADLWCARFFYDAILLLQCDYDIVVGSKRLVASNDRRPWLRRLITASFNSFLKVVFGFRGTDTHGMKAVRRSSVLDVMNRCYTSKEVFDTELILKAQRKKLRICEIPTEVFDTRPARLSLLKRVPATVADLITIARTL